MCEQGRVGRGEGCMGAIGGSGGDQAGQVVRDQGPLSELLGGGGDGWTEGNTLLTMHPFTTTPGMTCPIPTTPLGFFHGRNE